MAMTMTAVTFAATLDRILNGLTRPFFGWVSDQIGRENTMFIAFGIEGIGIWTLYMLGHDPVWFVILSGLVFFAWGEIYSLFPSTCTDTFGANSRPPTPACFIPPRARSPAGTGRELHAAVSGNWDMVFIIAAGANILASLLAIAVSTWRKTVVANRAPFGEPRSRAARREYSRPRR